MSINLYLEQSGLSALLQGQEAAIEQAVTALKSQLAAVAAPAVTWSYQVPELGEGGACSLFGQLAEQPYDLAATLGQNEATAQALSQLTAVVQNYQQSNDSDWFGIYQKRQNPQGETVLVKLIDAGYGISGLSIEPARLHDAFVKGIRDYLDVKSSQMVWS